MILTKFKNLFKKDKKKSDANDIFKTELRKIKEMDDKIFKNHD
jgi:hypothetical protein